MKYVLRLFLLSTLLGLLIFAGCQETPDAETRKIATYPNVVEGEPNIRVLALESAQAVELLVPGKYSLKVILPDGKTQTGGAENAVTVSVEPSREGIKLGQNSYRSAEVTPLKGNLSVRFQQIDAKGKAVAMQKTFPGTFVFQRSATGKLQVIVRLPVEQYLIGVLPGEMELSSAPEALKAQAVACRTYALYQIRTAANAQYDVYADVRSQMWTPVEQADPRARLAVNTTSGIVLTENYRIFPAYFSADCGGKTANGRFVFSGSDISVLRGGVECPHASQAYTYDRFALSREDLAARLAKAGIANGRILRIERLDEKQQPMNVMGRVYYVRVVMDNGVERIVPANKFRLAVGAGKTELSSTQFFVKASPENNYFVFQTRGFGHGVGMCQQGAKYMASKGSDFIDILNLYYPGAKLLRLW